LSIAAFAAAVIVSGIILSGAALADTENDRALIKLFSRLHIVGKPTFYINRAAQIRKWLDRYPNTIRKIDELDLSFLKLKMLPSELNLFTGLITLDLTGNQLQMLPKLSAHPKLRVIYLNDNQLISVDFSENPELTDVYLNNNRLSHVDFSKNPKILVLYSSYNQLTEVDLRNLLLLTHLYLCHNLISHVDVRNNGELRVLSMGFNPMKDIDLRENRFLEELYLRSMPPGTLPKLNRNLFLKVFILTFNQISEALSVENPNK
jgi:Leucine-rich repeat (LRR) protein